MTDTPIIAVENLSKNYGKTVGIRKLDFQVNQGEIFGFLGPNGAGKTTTIRLLLDLLRPTSGRASIFGLPIRNNSLEIRRRCGYLPGNFSAYGEMTGTEFLRFVAEISGKETALQVQLVDRFSLAAGDLAQKIKHLSHGTRQKLGIVQAFFHNPELLILDEPTIGLDPLMQEEFYRLLLDFQRNGSTIFFSSHNLPEVEKVCHRVAIIRAGELVALETLEALKKKRYRRLHLTLREEVENVALPEAELLSQIGRVYNFLVKGNVENLLWALARLPVEDLVFPEPELEEVFMTYYRRDRDE